MKKFISCFSLMLCVLLGAICFSACGSTGKWITPEFEIENQGFKIELVTNAEADFEFPIKNVKLDHSKYEENVFEYVWAIKNATTNELVGWIEASGGYEGDKNKGFKYGFSPSYANDVYTFGTNSVCVILKSTDLSIFDNLNFTVNIGNLYKVEDNNPFSATKRYTEEYNPEVGGEIKPLEGSQNFVCCNYIADLTGIEPKNIDTIKFNLNIPGLVI